MKKNEDNFSSYFYYTISTSVKFLQVKSVRSVGTQVAFDEKEHIEQRTTLDQRIQ